MTGATDFLLALVILSGTEIAAPTALTRAGHVELRNADFGLRISHDAVIRNESAIRIQQSAMELPALTQPVNDFAGVIPADRASAMDRVIRSLEAASGDTIIVATVDTFQPYGDIREYANKLFENHGRGIGHKGKDNGVLILLAVRDRQVWIEVGYDLEPFITDGFAGETSRQYMAPDFRKGDYAAGLQAGLVHIAHRIADARHVTLQDVPRERSTSPDALDSGHLFMLALFGAFMLLKVLGATSRFNSPRRRSWGGGAWSGWISGVGPFGGGFGGGGGGFGGGFGGFGGGRSGGGGGGAGW